MEANDQKYMGEDRSNIWYRRCSANFYEYESRVDSLYCVLNIECGMVDSSLQEKYARDIPNELGISGDYTDGLCQIVKKGEL